MKLLQLDFISRFVPLERPTVSESEGGKGDVTSATHSPIVGLNCDCSKQRHQQHTQVWTMDVNFHNKSHRLSTKEMH